MKQNNIAYGHRPSTDVNLSYISSMASDSRSQERINKLACPQITQTLAKWPV